MPRKKLNSLFQPTEPEPIADPRQATEDSAEEQSAELAKPKRKPQRIKPQSVYLNESELAYIQQIADEYGESRHAVMQYAIKELIRQYKRGKKFRTNNLGKLDK